MTSKTLKSIAKVLKLKQLFSSSSSDRIGDSFAVVFRQNSSNYTEQCMTWSLTRCLRPVIPELWLICSTICFTWQWSGVQGQQKFQVKAGKRNGDTNVKQFNPTLYYATGFAKKYHIPHFPGIFGDFQAVSITTTILGSETILGTVQVLTFNLYHPTLEVWTSLHSWDTYLCSSAIFQTHLDHKCCELRPIIPWWCSSKTSFPWRHCCSNTSSIKHQHFI